MMLFFGIYLTGVAVAYIATLCMWAKSKGEITIGDLLLCLLMGIFSWFTILVYFTESINWDTTVWKRKKKEDNHGREEENNSKTAD